MRLAKHTLIFGLGAVAALVACSGVDPGSLICTSPAECPTGWHCVSGKCAKGQGTPEVTIVNNLSGLTFKGQLSLRAKVVDQAAVTGVTVKLGSLPAVAATQSAGTDLWDATLDLTAFAGQDTTVNLVVTATDANGGTGTASATIHIDETTATLSLAANKILLAAGGSAVITATFSKALSGLPTATISGAAASEIVLTSGAAGGTVFTFTVTAPATGTPGSAEEGPHTVTVQGVTAAGDTVSSTVVVTYEFRSPSITLAVDTSTGHTTAGVLAEAMSFVVDVIADRALNTTLVSASLSACAPSFSLLPVAYTPPAGTNEYRFTGVVPAGANGACTATKVIGQATRQGAQRTTPSVAAPVAQACR
jgi:hypothetical protein